MFFMIIFNILEAASWFLPLCLSGLPTMALIIIKLRGRKDGCRYFQAMIIGKVNRVSIVMWRVIVLLSFHSCFVWGRTVREIRCDCGIRNEGNRHISIGENDKVEFAGNHAWPWMASIVNISDSDDPVAYCGGSLINNQYILTAGHCIPDMEETGLDGFRIFIGTNYITDELDENYLELKISKIISHPKFDFETADFDAALIKLSEKVRFSKTVRPVCLQQPEDANNLVGEVGIITGWGSFNITTPTEEELKESDIIIVSKEECQKNYSTVDIPVTETMLCASLRGQDPCKGDSGGPLIIKDSKNKFNQIGIISHGQGCSVPDFPTIFSKVSVFIDWIGENTQDALYCKGTF